MKRSSADEQRLTYVPALVRDKIIIPEFWLGNIEYRTEDSGVPPSAAEYNQQMELPTLAELRRAFFDRKSDGSWVCPFYRKAILSDRGVYNDGIGEWTSTWIRGENELIERPEKNLFDKNRNLIVDGGKVTKVELPPEGWVLEYDDSTGLAIRTSLNKCDAEKNFGEDTSYFKRPEKILNTNKLFVFKRSSVIATRYYTRSRYYLVDYGSFRISAMWYPSILPQIGGRECRRGLVV